MWGFTMGKKKAEEGGEAPVQDAHHAARAARTQAAKDAAIAEELRDAELRLEQAKERVARLRGGS